MCIIIDNRKAKTIADDIISASVWLNPDGFGLYLPERGKVFRTLDMDVAEDLLSRLDEPYIAHCRYATKGTVSEDNIHPVKCHDGSYLFQNGTINGLKCDDTLDTAQVAEMLRYVRPKHAKSFLSSFSSRFCLIRPNGSVIKTGSWVRRSGVSFSKEPCDWMIGRSAGGRTSYSGRQSTKSTYKVGNQSTSTATSDRDKLPAHYRNKPDTSIVAVYGTLKRDHGNNGYLDTAEYLCSGRTADLMRLCIQGLPFMIEGAHPEGHNVEVECYRVDETTLKKLDDLEGHPSWYKRRMIPVETLGGYRLECWCYVAGDDCDDGRYYDTF